MHLLRTVTAKRYVFSPLLNFLRLFVRLLLTYSFLCSLANFSVYSLEEVISGSTVVTQQISTVTMFVTVFYYALRSTVSTTFLISLSVALAIFGFVVRFLTDKSFEGMRNHMLTSLFAYTTYLCPCASVCVCLCVRVLAC